jgi:endonuclease YncB( thermonuclease family)
MLPRILVFFALLGALLPAHSVSAQSEDCASYDAWIWAQTVFDTSDGAMSGLDADGDGVACPSLPISGFAPVLWTDEIPASAVPAQVTNIVDGDTFDVIVDGQSDRVRLYHIDAPETAFEQHCGGPEATSFLSFILQWAPNSTVYLEYDQTERDSNDRRLAYAWYELGGDVYMVNEAMVRSGWAESDTFRPDDKYKEHLDAAETFSVDKVLGVRLLCGRFGQEPGSSPSNQQVRQAMFAQPNQGQFAQYLPDPTPVPQPTQAPAPQQPVPESPSQQPSGGDCDPNYTPCVPNVSYDLDCGDIGFSVTVTGYDRHGFDREGDGWGCESYG